MEILQQDNGPKGKFYVEQNGEQLAEMAYVWAGKERMIIEHTDVNETLAGKGVGKQLVAKAVELAREKKFKIIPLCPFARAVFNKTEEYKDVLV